MAGQHLIEAGYADYLLGGNISIARGMYNLSGAGWKNGQP
jgi:hypothetical protein